MDGDHLPRGARAGAGGGSGIGFSGGWPSSGGGSGKDETTADLPARMNVKIGSNRVYEDMVRAFVAAHGDAPEEHGVVVVNRASLRNTATATRAVFQG